ncbi:hypothetical protein ACFXKR_40015 [Streptomyces violascens]|uniref:hypothetical protein n=1 Tax=Streptomyces violascens TaxID=67381 RepID=UPI003689C209
MASASGSPVAPATLRRYLLEFRIYNVWAEQRETQADSAVPVVLEELARRGITGQYNRPLEAATVQEFVGPTARAHLGSHDGRGAHPKGATTAGDRTAGKHRDSFDRGMGQLAGGNTDTASGAPGSAGCHVSGLGCGSF